MIITYSRYRSEIPVASLLHGAQFRAGA